MPEHWQFEVVTQFCVGVYTEDMAYVDDWRLVAAKLCLSPTGVWFDVVTSIPWSFIDLHSYLVSLLSHRLSESTL
jgi:hypothetical protein